MTPRLSAIAAQVPPVTTAIDVGCDHAQVGIWLTQHHIVRNMTVSDINEGPLLRARSAIERAGLTGRITCVRCDGLDGIPPQDAVIIAGMGGELIADILRRAPWTRVSCRLVLQPMTAGEELRAFLFQNGYQIQKETIAREREKLYTILTVCPGVTETWSEADCTLSDLSDPLAGIYLNQRIRRLQRMIEGKRAAEHPEEAEIARLAALCAELKERRAHCADSRRGL